MWLYIPTASTSSASAPAAEASISASSSQCQALAASCSWRGKLSRQANWSARYSKVSWLRPLFGAMLPPSTAARGVESWMASLAASRASPIASPASGAGAPTSATSGLTQGASSSSPEPGSSSSKTSPACSRQSPALIRARYGSGVTYKDWVLELRRDCLRRQKSARAISANGSLFSVWPTPKVVNGGPNSKREERNAGGPDLQEMALSADVVAMVDAAMSLPKLSPENGTARPGLSSVSLNWPTPAARDWRSDSSQKSSEEMYGTKGRPLARVAMEWQTPSVADTTGSRMTRSGERSNELLLKGQAANLMDQWPTPRSHEVGDYQYSKGDKTKPVATLTGRASSLPAHPIYQVGQVSSHPRRSLNPLFVEWLMGWPPGWTLLAWTDFACSETALSAYKQRMRFALSELGLPPKAPPAQLGLFR